MNPGKKLPVFLGRPAGESDKQGQGSLDYLLLLAGGVLVTVMVFIILINLPLENMLGNNLLTYESTVNLDAFIGSGGNNPLDGDAPTNVLLAVAPGTDGIQLDFSAQDASPITYTLIRSKTDSVISTIPAGNFEQWGGSHGITLVAGALNASPFLDSTIWGGVDYYYRVQACDNAAPRNCAASGVQVGTYHAISNVILGPAVIALSDWCEEDDVPDNPAHAVRDPMDNGQLIFFSGNAPHYYVSKGTDFDTLTRQCTNPALESNEQTAANTFNNYEWISSVFSDGTKIHALVHNEYHDSTSPPPCNGLIDPSNPCWYNVIESGSSTNGGLAFDPAPPQRNPIVAAPPLQWNMNTMGGTPYGYFGPSNIVSRVEGSETAYYTLILSITSIGDPPTLGTCLLRTTNLDDHASWRAWDGSGFTITTANPYIVGETQVPCAPVSPETIGSLSGSLTYNTALNAYMLIGTGRYPYNGISTCGVWYSLSTDLITWGTPALITDAQFGPPCTGESNMMFYPSLIDHDSSDPTNFTEADQTAYLYYQTITPGSPLERQLWRRPLTFPAP